ncbi:MAG: T9SS type A sorting domain-containing protein [Bacteroidia bacterium]
MKKLLLTFSLLLPITLIAQVTYHHYLNNTVTWFEYSSYYIFPTFQPPCYLDGLSQTHHRYHVMGEDTIDGYAWYQIHYDAITEVYCGNNTQPTVVTPSQTPSFYFRIREDSLGNIWQRTDQQTKLLYEFRPAMGIGDTLWMNDHVAECVIDSLDTLYLGTDPRQRYWCACDSGSPTAERAFVVEGIGYSRNFDNLDQFCQTVVDNQFFMICVEKDGDTLVLNSQEPCGIPMHNPVSVEEPLLEGLQVAWIAADEELLLRQTRPLPELQWEILDMQGKLLANGAEFRERIALPGLSAGLYIFRGESQGRRQVLKFMK